ncbi:epoxyqueuosine reductase [Desulfobacula sp.]
MFKTSKIKKMRDRYRKFAYVSDIAGIVNSIGEMHGKGFLKQPKLNKNFVKQPDSPVFHENWFIEKIKDLVVAHPDNCKEYPFYGEKIFDEPLIGFIKGDDPLLEQYKDIIGPHHFTPYEIMKIQAESNGVKPPKASDLSVVSFTMPIIKETKKDNARKKKWPCERWAQTRRMGEMFSQVFVREIIVHLMENGILAIAPDVTPMFNKKRYPKVGWASPWSHRHMAYAAGLGTFGMQDFLITRNGVAHRVGSFVVNLQLEPNHERPADIHAWCLHRQGHSCLKCASRCPVNAIDKNGHDKERCYQHVKASTKYCIKNFKIFIYGCGLCATRVPCESGIPDGIESD